MKSEEEELKCLLFYDSIDEKSNDKKLKSWNDISGFGNNGKIRGATYNEIEKAFYFDGKSTVRREGVLPQECEKYTFEAYFKTSDDNKLQVVMEQNSSDNTHHQRASMFLRTHTNDKGQKLGGFNGNFNDRDTHIVYKKGKWIHWVLVINIVEDEIKMYLNGNLTVTEKCREPEKLNLSNECFLIGGPAVSSKPEYFKGLIKRVKVLQGCLSDDDVWKSYMNIMLEHHHDLPDTPEFKKKLDSYFLYNPNDVTILIEGVNRCTNIQNTVRKYKHYCKQIIMSSYLDDQVVNELKEINPGIIIINKDKDLMTKNTDDRFGRINKDFRKRGFEQFFHMETLLPQVKTPYVIKTRMDQVFSNIDYFIRQTILNTGKITLFPYYIRGATILKYHPSDMLIGSKTELMRDVWLPTKYEGFRKGNNLIEPAIFTGYLNDKANEFDPSSPINEMSPEQYGIFMARLFAVVNPKRLEPYKVHNKINFFSRERYRKIDESCENNTYIFFSTTGCDYRGI